MFLLDWWLLLAAARKQAASREILLWKTPSEAPKASQASECRELLDPMGASCWISAQHWPGKFKADTARRFSAPVALLQQVLKHTPNACVLALSQCGLIVQWANVLSLAQFGLLAKWAGLDMLLPWALILLMLGRWSPSTIEEITLMRPMRGNL